MNPAAGLIFVSALLLPAPVLAQAGEPMTPTASERRLSPEQIEMVLSEAAKKREAAEGRSGPNAIERAPKPQIQGEAGFSVGTGGHREAFGTVVYPMGNDGAAAISLDFVDLGRRRDRR